MQSSFEETPGLRSLLLLNSLCMGGAEKQVVSLFNRIAGAGHVAFLQCLKTDDTLLEQIDPARRGFVQKTLGVRSGIEARAVRELARRIDALRIDVILCTNMYALLYGRLAQSLCARSASVRIVEVFHTTDVGSRKELWSMALYKRLVRSADLLVFVCHSQAAHWHARGLGARHDIVIYNGIDTQRFVDHWSAADKADLRARSGLAGDGLVLGLCAVMRPEKAHLDFLDALARVRSRGLPVRGLLIGDGPMRPQIEARIRALDLEDAVRITGLVDDVRPVIAQCDAMVLSSHAVETFSIAALEAMALGKPMIMTRIGGAAEQVVDGVDGMLYPPGDIDALASAIEALADPGHCRRMGAAAAARVHSTFDVERMVCSYRKALEAVATQRTPRSDPLMVTTAA
jgi:glycosyltransferase involved in cell wall biosynthesis